MSQTEPAKDLKVKLPVRYHMQLHTLKILSGKNLSQTLAEALDQYFAQPAQAALPQAARDALES